MIAEQIVIDFPSDSHLSSKFLPKMTAFAAFGVSIGKAQTCFYLLPGVVWKCPLHRSPCTLDPPASSQADPVRLSLRTIKTHLLIIDSMWVTIRETHSSFCGVSGTPRAALWFAFQLCIWQCQNSLPSA